MRVGISYWGFCESFTQCRTSQTPDGHRYGRPLLVDELTTRGHDVYALQMRRENNPYPGLTYYPKQFPDLDILFLEWRWPTYKNSGEGKFEPDLDRQTELLDHYHGKIPIVAWDTDLKMTPDDEKRWPQMIVADPTLDPVSFTIPRVKMTFWSDFKPLISPAHSPILFGYIGNNYERRDMFKEYYAGSSKNLRNAGIQTSVWGNWLQRSPEREQPEEIVRQYPYVSFSNRVGFYDSMQLLNKFIATVHITKPRYAKQGFASPRYLENLVVGTPALVPHEFAYNNILGNEWMVSDGLDVARKVKELKNLPVKDRISVVEEQRNNLLDVWDFSLSRVVEFLENVAYNQLDARKNT